MRLNIDIYRCDPDKNEMCAKTGCHIFGGPCIHTTHAEYAMSDENGKAVVEKKAVRNEPGDKEVRVYCESCDHHYEDNGGIFCRRLNDRATVKNGFCHRGVSS